MFIRFNQLVLAVLFFGLLPGANLAAQDTPTQANGAGAIASGGGGFRALSGAEAGFFVLPDDVDLISTRRIARHGLTYERYQQVFGSAKVLGGQLTLYRNDAGDITTVIGAHYPGIVPTNAARLAAAEARGIADRDIGPAGQRFTDLMIDPRSGRYFYRVETRRTDSRWIHWIGAQSGQVFNKYNALMHQTCGTPPYEVSAPCGIGVEYDRGDDSDVKNLIVENLLDGIPFSLSSPVGLPWCPYGPYCLWSDPLTIDGHTYRRQETYDQGSTTPIFSPDIARDDDEAWVISGRQSPGQAAPVDAHYNAYVTDQYFLNTYGFDWVHESVLAGRFDAMVVQAHYKINYNNAFWNGQYVTFGDGDDVIFRELTSLDVVAHELTHGVTDFTADLIYQNESGALNEAFSDIMAAGAEWFAAANGLEPGHDPADPAKVAFAPDYLVGEEIYVPELDAPAPGFRNMEDPEEDGDPDHYSERFTGTGDNGGVHTNSGIPNHAFYLLANGGQNASCVDTGTHNSVHCAAPEPSVDGIGLADAEQIFFMAFTALTADATMCNARIATEAAAVTIFGDGSSQHTSTGAAWAAVGVSDTACPDPLADNPPDNVNITQPLDQDVVSGKRAWLRATAQDDDGITKFEFFLPVLDADNPICVDSGGSNSGSCRWNSKSVSDGDYVMIVRAWDTALQSTDSTPIAVTVQNGSGGGDPTGDPGTINCKKKTNRDHPDCTGG